MTNPIRFALFLDSLFSWQGGKEYVRNILLSLDAYRKEKRNDSVEVHLFSGEAIAEGSLDEFRSQADGLHRISHDFGTNPESFFRDLEQKKIDVIFPMHNIWCATNVRPIGWIYDFQHKYQPELFPESDLAYREASFSQMLLSAHRVVVSSETSRQDLQKFYPGDDKKIVVLPFATFPKEEWRQADPRQTVQRYHLPERFFLLSSQFWMHKNHTVVFQALKKLHDEGVDVALVCTGSLHDYRKPSYVDDLLAYLHQHGIYKQVRIMGLMPRIDQLQLMRCALAVVQPSFFEGWSTVLEDARTFGKITLSSALPVHLEQNVPRAEFFQPKDSEHLARLLSTLWQSGHSGFDAAQEAEAFAQARARSLAFAESIHRLVADTESFEIYPQKLERENMLFRPAPGLHYLPGCAGLRMDGWCNQTITLRLGPALAGDSLVFEWRITVAGEPVPVEIQVGEEKPVQVVVQHGDFRHSILLNRDHPKTDMVLRFATASPISAEDPFRASALLNSVRIEKAKPAA